jgi:hypothetical protein
LPPAMPVPWSVSVGSTMKVREQRTHASGGELTLFRLGAQPL